MLSVIFSLTSSLFYPYHPFMEGDGIFAPEPRVKTPGVEI